MTTPVEKVAGTMLVTGSASAVGGGMWVKWLGENHEAIAAMGILAGIAVGVLGLLVKWYYLHRDSKRRDRRVSDLA